MKISICAPSYKRPHKVDTKKYLPGMVRYYVDPSEFDEYLNGNPGEQIIACAPGVQGNISRVRNHILKTELAAGADAVCTIDDDLRGIFYFEDHDTHRVEPDRFEWFLIKHSILAQEWGAKLWGINLSLDKQNYRENAPFSTTSYIGSPFTVFLKGNDCWYDEALPLKEDYDMTLQQLNKYRVVVRINKYYYDVKQAEQIGGAANMRTLDVEAAQMRLLQKKWGTNIVRIEKLTQNRSHKSTKVRRVDINPIIRAPIRGI